MIGKVVTPEPHASEAGVGILEKGGNAIDAAISAAFVQGVVNPFHSGLGGSGYLLGHISSTNETFHIDCSCTMGSKRIPDRWANEFVGRSEAYGRYIIDSEENQFGYKSIMVPGFVMGAWEAFEKYGSGNVSWKEILEPSINLATDGFEVYPYLEQLWSSKDDTPGHPNFSKKIINNADSKNIYGIPKQTGDIFIQKDYGNTLNRIAKNGGLDFYQGEIGEQIVKDLTNNDAMITRDDLENYSAPETEIVIGHYRGYEIRGAVSGSSSSAQVIAMLQIMDGFDVKQLGHNSPEYIDIISQVMRAGFKDHLQLKGDPPHSVATDLLRKYTSKERAQYWQEKIKNGGAIEGPKDSTGLGSDTTHVSVIDKDGSAVSWTHTLGSMGGSGTVTENLGFLYNNFVGHFNPVHGYWNSILPGKRGGGGAPLLIYKDGKLAMVIGAPGGSRIITAVFQTILNVIDHGMSMQDAVDATRFHSEEKNIIYLEPHFTNEIANDLQKKYQIKRSTYMSRVQAIWIDPTTGNVTTGTDPRGMGGQKVIS